MPVRAVRYKYGSYTTYRKTKVRKKIDIRAILFSLVDKFIILILMIGIVLCGIGVAYKAYYLARLKTIKQELIKENEMLNSKYNQLLKRNILLNKAKKLGLYPPTKKDIIKGGIK